MRRFNFYDDKYDVKITLDIPEELFKQMRSHLGGIPIVDSKKNLKKVYKKARELAIYTLNNLSEDE